MNTDIFMVRPVKTVGNKQRYPEYNLCKEIIQWAKVIRDAGYNPRFACHELEEVMERRATSVRQDTLVG